MADASDYMENQVMDAVVNAGSFSVAVPWISLHTADPGETGATEVTGGSYARQNGSAAFPAAAAGSVSNDVLIEFTGMPAVTVTHVGIWDASTAGNFIMKGVLSASQAVGAGNTFQIKIGDLTLSLA